MGWFSDFTAFRKLKNETRGSGLFETSVLLQNILLGSDTNSGEFVSVESALKLTDVNTCLRVISESVSQIQKTVIQDRGKDKTKLKNHHVWGLMNGKASQFVTSYNFFHSITYQGSAHGNGYGFVQRNQQLRPVELFPLETPLMETSINRGVMSYKYNGEDQNPRDILHFKINSRNGYTGESPILQNKETIGLSLKHHKFMAATIGTIPPSFFSTDLPIKKEQADLISDSWDRRTTGKTPIVPNGLKLNRTQITPAEAELGLNSRNLTQKIYGIWRVPRSLGQDYSDVNFATSVQQDLNFVKHTLLPYSVNFAQELNDKLFTEKEKADGLYINFDLKGFLKADMKSQNEAARLALSHGVHTPKSWLDMLDEDSGEASDLALVQSNMIPIDLVKEYYESLIKKNQQGGANVPGVVNAKMKTNGQFI